MARAIINRVLVGIYFLGRERLELLKSLVLELVVMMCRAAVEAGANPSELFGGHYRALADLAQIRDDEALTRWLTDLLERSFTDLLTEYRVDHAAQLLARTRNSVAEIALACGFPDQSYFTKVFKRRTGRTPLAYRQFSDPLPAGTPRP